MTNKAFEFDGQLLPVMCPFKYKNQDALTKEQQEAFVAGVSAERELNLEIFGIYKNIAQFEDNPRELKSIFDNLELAAGRGELAALLILGKSLLEGSYVSKDELRGLQMLVIAAKQGSAEAQSKVALYYEDLSDDGCSWEVHCSYYAKALPFAYAGASQGDAECNRIMASCYQHGMALEKNPVEALLYLHRVADAKPDEKIKEAQGLSCRLIGDFYRDGSGVTADAKLAAEWYEKAIKFGNKRARESLAKLSGTSKSSEPDFVYKNVSVWVDAGVFTFDGVKRPISAVRGIAYRAESPGCAGGRSGKIIIKIDDLKTPQLYINFTTFSSDSFTTEVLENYERLGIALGCNDR